MVLLELALLTLISIKEVLPIPLGGKKKEKIYCGCYIFVLFTESSAFEQYLNKSFSN